MPSLTLANSLRATITYSPFSPASLFSGGAPGVWYDPSDYSTLFQDSAGTTPVTAVEQPVGLMLDKSQGLVLGPELVADYTTGYTASGTANVTVSAGEVIATADGSSATPGYYYAITTVVGQQYYVTGVLRSPTTNTMYLGANSSTSMGSNINRASSFSASSTQVGFFFTAVGTTTYIFVYGSTGTVGNAYAGRNISVKYRPGNHAFQSTSASRPVLSARYNLLTKTEQLEQSPWSGSLTVSSGITYNGISIQKLTNSATGTTQLKTQTVTTSTATTFDVTAYASYVDAPYVVLFATDGVANGLRKSFNITDGTVGATQTIGSGWTFVSASMTLVAPGVYRLLMRVTNSSSTRFDAGAHAAVDTDGTTNSTSGKSNYVGGFSVLPANQSTLPYQRVNTATDYATTGFLPYLKFDGVDDSLSTNSINFTSTDKMSVFAGVRKLSGAAVGMLMELSASLTAGNNGAFYYVDPNTPATTEMAIRGSTSANILSSYNGGTAPITRVTSAVLNLAASTRETALALRQNGATVGTTGAITPAGGNYGNYPLYIGRRGGSTIPFNGQLYSMIIVGKAVNAVELTSTETYTASKTGVVLA